MLSTKYDEESLGGDFYDPFLEAIKSSNCKAIKLLTNAGLVDINRKYQGYGAQGRTPLLFAAEIGNREVILLLLAKGAKVQDVTDDGFNALHLAARCGHVGVLQDLVKAGIDVNAVSGAGTTALHEASAKGHQSAAEKLLELKAGASIQALTPTKAVTKKKKKKKKKNAKAAQEVNTSFDPLTKKLIDKLQALSLERDDDIDALLYAINQSNCSLISSIVDSKIIDVNKRYVRYGGKTPLHYAAEIGNREVVLLLLAKGANAQAVTERGFNALHVAAQFGHACILQDLVAAGIDVNSFTGPGTTALHEAAVNGLLEATLKLLDLNADITMKDGKCNKTAYDLASLNGHDFICKALYARFNYKQRFIFDVNKVLADTGLKLNINSNEIGFILKLRTAIEHVSEADDVFKIIGEQLKSEEFKRHEKTLSKMRQSLIELMKQYNADQSKANSARSDKNLKK